MVKIIKASLMARKEIVSGTSEVTFDTTGQDFYFEAGQYVKIIISEMPHQDTKGNLRLFSVVSSPNDKKHIEIVFRDSKSAFKKSLRDMPLGSKVEIQGPYGLFLLPKDRKTSIVFVAGGVGIAPCLSMIRFVTEETLDYPMFLIYGNNSQESIAYGEELERLNRENQNFSFVNHMGYIDIDCIKKSVKDLESPIWYIVGPPAMVETTKKILAELGVDASKIKFERFTGM